MRLRHLLGCGMAVVLTFTLAGPADAAAMPSLTKMRTALLRGSDLPSEFTRDRSSRTSTTAHSTNPTCTAMVSDGAMYDPFGEAPRKVSRSFAAGTTSVGSGVGAWRGKAGPVAYVKYLRKALRTCDDPWSETDDDGIRYRIRLSRLDFPQLGADRVALRYSVIGRGTVDVIGHLDVVLVRVRNAVTIVTESRIGSRAPVDLEALTRKSVTRLRAIL